MKKVSSKNHRGFTLIEIIVSLGIFSVVAVVALGALVKIITANKKAQTIQAAVTNINFALDSMSREIRMGRNHYCGSNVSGFSEATLSQNYDDYTTPGGTKCSGGLTNESTGTAFAFLSTRVGRSGPGSPCNLITAYLFEKQANGSYYLKKAEQQSCGDTTYSFESILDPNVTLTGYYLSVAAPDANAFPLTTIRISGYAGVLEKEKTFFDIQTALSARTQ